MKAYPPDRPSYTKKREKRSEHIPVYFSVTMRKSAYWILVLVYTHFHLYPGVSARFLERGDAGRLAAATRGVGRGEGVPLPTRGGVWGENFWTFAFKMVHFLRVLKGFINRATSSSGRGFRNPTSTTAEAFSRTGSTNYTNRKCC